MSALLAGLALAAGAWLSFAAATSLAVACGWRLGAARVRRAPPARRAWLAWAAATSPCLVPTLLLLVCLVPGIGGALGGGDHCLAHPGHPHLCVVHLPEQLSGASAGLLGLGGAAVVFAAGRAARRLRRDRRLIAALRAAATKDFRPGVHVVASERPFSLASGTRRGEIWVASSLLRALSEEGLAVVLAHERAHLDRRDPLRRASAELMSWPLPPGVRRAILGELALASERACDEQAAGEVGDRLRVAETIVAVERLAGRAASSLAPGLPAFGGSSVALRVEALLAEAPSVPAHGSAAGWLAALAVTAAALAADPLHHATEHWLRWLLGGG